MRESQIEAALVKFAKENGVLTYKFSSPAHRGVPDRIFIGHGRVLFLEIKQKGKKPTTLQRREMRQINDHGGHAHWCDNVCDGEDIICSICIHI